MLLKRSFAAQIYEGQDDDGVIETNALISEVADDPGQKEVIVSAHSLGGGQIVASGSLTVPLPNGYTNASYLHVTVIAEGLIRVKTTSPDHGSSTTLVQGSSTAPGMHQICEKVTTLTIENTSAATAVKVSYLCVAMPDISDEDYFRGLQSNGTQSAVS